MSEPAKQVWCYVGRKEDGEVRAVTVDDGSPLMRSHVKEFLDSNLTIERVPLEWARENLFTNNVWRAPDNRGERA